MGLQEPLVCCEQLHKSSPVVISRPGLFLSSIVGRRIKVMPLGGTTCEGRSAPLGFCMFGWLTLCSGSSRFSKRGFPQTPFPKINLNLNLSLLLTLKAGICLEAMLEQLAGMRDRKRRVQQGSQIGGQFCFTHFVLRTIFLTTE